jgi:hypothetical protein
MISVRSNCFETNSSSMHSICISKKSNRVYDEYDMTLGNGYNIEDGVFHLLKYSSDTDGYHRAPFEVLVDPIEKLRYLVGLFVSYKYHPEKKGHDAYEYFIEPDAKKEFDELIKKATGCDSVQYYYDTFDDGQEWPYTSTSNDSGENVYSFIKRKGLTFEQVVFDPRISIQVDGDEYQEFKKMFELGLINKDAIEDISSGTEFWFDEDYSIWVDELSDTNINSSWDKTTAYERADKGLAGKLLILLYRVEEAKEEDWRLLVQLAKKHNIHKVRVAYGKVPEYANKFIEEITNEGI